MSRTRQFIKKEFANREQTPNSPVPSSSRAELMPCNADVATERKNTTLNPEKMKTDRPVHMVEPSVKSKELTQARMNVIREFLLENLMHPGIRRGEIASTYWVNILIQRLKMRGWGTGNVTSSDVIRWLDTRELLPLYTRLKSIAASGSAMGSKSTNPAPSTPTSEVSAVNKFQADIEKPASYAKEPESQKSKDENMEVGSGKLKEPAPVNMTKLQSNSVEAAGKKDDDPPSKKKSLDDGLMILKSNPKSQKPSRDTIAWLQASSQQLLNQTNAEKTVHVTKEMGQQEVHQGADRGSETIPAGMATEVERNPPDVQECMVSPEIPEEAYRGEEADHHQGFLPRVSVEGGRLVIKIPSCSRATTFCIQPTRWLVSYHSTVDNNEIEENTQVGDPEMIDLTTDENADA